MPARQRGPGPASPGTVYLLHFSRPISPDHTAQHYIGWASQLEARLGHHAAGSGARLTAVAIARGITWQVARTWEGDRSLERRLKRRHEGPRLCPVCRKRAITARRRPSLTTAD